MIQTGKAAILAALLVFCPSDRYNKTKEGTTEGMHMKRRKKITAVLLIILSIMTSVPVQAQEIADVQESIDAVRTDYLTSEDGQWQYEIRNEEIYLDRYLGDAESVVIPDTIDGYVVKRIPLTTLFINNYTVKEVSLPKTITSIAGGVFASAYALESITIDKTSADGFHSVDGVLYNGSQLVAYPAAREGKEYAIPNGTTSIMSYAFYGCSNLEKAVVPSSVINISTTAFSRSIKAVDIVIKRISFTTSYVDGICWQMAAGTRLLVKNEGIKDQLDSEMKRTDGYKNSTDIMTVEVMNPTPATALTFSDGTTEAWVQASYTDTGYTGDPVNNFYLQSLYQQEPYDTTDNVTWSLVSADTCPAILNEKNLNKYVCQVTSGGTIITYAGGNAVLKGTDESGHELILHVAVYSPMEGAELYGYNNIENPNIDMESQEDDEWNTIFADIYPNKSYAWNQEVVWESLDPKIVQVESLGVRKARVKGLQPGKALVKASINNDGKIVEKTMEITVRDSLANCTVDPVSEQIYSGNLENGFFLPEEEMLKPKVALYYKGKVLSEENYEVSYAGQQIGANDNRIWITGKNLFYGKIDIQFVITHSSSNNRNPDSKTAEDQEPSTNVTTSITPSTGDPNTASNDPEQGNGTDTAIKTFQAKNIKYTVTSAKEVKVTGTTKKSIRSITIPATVKYKRTTYKVTSIGSKAFYNCKKLKTVTIKSRKLKSVGKNAFKGIYKKAKVTVPKSKYKAYRKLFKKAGFGSKTVWKKK